MKIISKLGLKLGGKLGDSCVAVVRGDTNYLRENRPRRGPPTYLQAYRQELFLAATEAWENLPENARATYKAEAGPRGNGYNLFIKRFLTAVREQQSLGGIDLDEVREKADVAAAWKSLPKRERNRYNAAAYDEDLTGFELFAREYRKPK